MLIDEEKLQEIEQQQLLQYWGQLTRHERAILAQQVDAIDSTLVRQQRQRLASRPHHQLPIAPLSHHDSSGNLADVAEGRHLLAQGKVGCLLVAGGQGSRLSISGPKGTFPVTPIAGKSLFQLAAERVAAASRQAGRPLPLAVMTAPDNHDATVEFFRSHGNFGVAALEFFTQDSTPLLDQKGDLFLEEKGKIACAPNGNGYAFEAFVRAGIWERWCQEGVEALHFVLVDNPLADPMDAELLGYHMRTAAEVTVKCIQRDDPDEKVGVLVQRGDRVAVVEYSEIDSSERCAMTPHGKLKYPCANISLFCFSMAFVERAAHEYCCQMPLHPVLKAARYLNGAGESVVADHPVAWKFEAFIFDLLPYSDAVRCLLYPRHSCFAPLKERSDLPAVQQALQAHDSMAWEYVAATPLPATPFELDVNFHYPTPSLLERWRGRPAPPSPYISCKE